MYRHSRRGRAVLHSLVPVICPPPAVALSDAIVDHLELTLAATPYLVGRGFAAGLVAYDLGALPRYLRRAQTLTGERAERYFRAWQHGPTPAHVQLARALNQLISLSCYEQPAMMEAVGYHPAPWIEHVTAKRLSVWGDAAREQARRILAPDPLRPPTSRDLA
jgi:hypothetical protein